MSHPLIYVTFALPEESQDFRKAIREGLRTKVRVEHFGVGPAMAADRVKHLLAGPTPRLLICAGFAGGLDPKLQTGDLVVAENLSTPEALARARAVAVPTTRFVFGSIVSRALPVESIADKAALFRETGALAVDMESEAVAAACRAAGVPLLVVRTISDPAGDALPVPFADWFDVAGQRPRIAGLLKYLATHPGRILPFARFVRGLAPARRALTRFLIGLDLTSDHPSG
ncbi:MAG TPA: hypothetical protein VK961_03640 [Chthoniobacter sp.]|nr:hypothetical protein [Chthoniobacter sp.]